MRASVGFHAGVLRAHVRHVLGVVSEPGPAHGALERRVGQRVPVQVFRVQAGQAAHTAPEVAVRPVRGHMHLQQTLSVENGRASLAPVASTGVAAQDAVHLRRCDGVRLPQVKHQGLLGGVGLVAMPTAVRFDTWVLRSHVTFEFDVVREGGRTGRALKQGVLDAHVGVQLSGVGAGLATQLAQEGTGVFVVVDNVLLEAVATLEAGFTRPALKRSHPPLVRSVFAVDALASVTGWTQLLLVFSAATVLSTVVSAVFRISVRHRRVVSVRHRVVVSVRHRGVVSVRHRGVVSARHSGVVSVRHRGVVSARHRGVDSVRHRGVVSVTHRGVDSIRHRGVISVRHRWVVSVRHRGVVSQIS